MPITISTRTDTRQLDAYLEWLDATPSNIQAIAKQDIVPAAQAYTTRELSPYPPPIAPGVFKTLATPKQLRYVMAKIRRGEWTGRTLRLQRGWVSYGEPIPEGARVFIRNQRSYARYVIGINQQPFHRVTGWIRLQEQDQKVLGHLNGVFINAYRKLQKERVRG